ncbi:hypothetical protein BT63DRAFT_436404 [Microthyrium microscopicum]|uniref:Uncharacterized protein n=1 Tax=Microthyrium microscopicum TaxID=703497 RepID=A0A6A6UX11_9PEZI|nr:hypothetical protein BT63DRAFT_436404 [Microthyrium microscopicum]
MGSPESPLPPLSVNNIQPPQVQPDPAAVDLAWTPSKAETLDTTRVTLSGHIPRAWERVPQPPVSEDSRFKKVWKAHNFPSQPSGSNSRRHTVQPQNRADLYDIPAIQSPQRALKKLRTGAPNDDLEAEESAVGIIGVLSSPTYVATKWEKRGTYLPRKRAQSLNPTSAHLADHTIDNSSLDDLNIAMMDANAIDLEDSRKNDLDDTLEDALVGEELIDQNDAEEVKKNTIADNYATTGTDPLSPTPRRDPEIQADHLVLTKDIDDATEVDKIMKATSKLEILAVSPQDPSKSRRKSMANNPGSSNVPDNVEFEGYSVPEDHVEGQQAHELLSSVDNSDLIDMSVAESCSAQPSHQSLISNQTRVEVSHESEDDSGNTSVLPEIDVDHKISETFVESLIQISAENKAVIIQQDSAEQHIASAAPLPLDHVNVNLVVTEDESKADMSPLRHISDDLFESSEENMEPSTQAHNEADQKQNLGAPSSPTPEAIEIDNAETPSPEEDVTATMTITSLQHLEEDKAFLQSFLDRTAASKANKPAPNAVDDNCTRRESVQNRRDSDAVRIALASPGRLPLENKGTNLFSPNKLLQSVTEDSTSLKKSPTKVVPEPEFVLPSVDDLFAEPAKPPSPRRSGRARTTRSASTTPNVSAPHMVAVRGNETMTLSLTKTENQLLVLETRRNTRKNKGPALSVPDRLVKWGADIAVIGKDGTTPEPKAVEAGQKGVRWSESMEFLNEATGQPEKEPLLFNEKAPEPIDPNNPVTAVVTPAKPSRVRVQTRSATNSVRRLRGLGAANGTPAKGVLASTLLPDEVAEQKQLAVAEATTNETPAPAPKPTKSIKTAATAAKAAKSRIPPPKKLNLTPSVKSVAVVIDEPVAPKPKARRASMLPVAGGAGVRKSRKT